MMTFWDVLTFLLESVLFLLIGLQLRDIISALHRVVGDPLLYAGPVFGTLVATRLVWMLTVPGLLRVVSLRRRGHEPRQTTGELLVLG